MPLSQHNPESAPDKISFSDFMATLTLSLATRIYKDWQHWMPLTTCLVLHCARHLKIQDIIYLCAVIRLATLHFIL